VKWSKIFNYKLLILVTIVIMSFSIVHISKANTVEPGTDQDPVITQSYVDKKISELNTKLESANTTINELTKKLNDYSTANEELKKKLQDFNPEEAKFKPVELKAGQKLIAGASAEIVLRSGKAKAVGGTYGGLSDITAASSVDLKTDADIPLNHLLLVSRDDGRGIIALKNSWIIIKGSYAITESK